MKNNKNKYVSPVLKYTQLEICNIICQSRSLLRAAGSTEDLLEGDTTGWFTNF